MIYLKKEIALGNYDKLAEVFQGAFDQASVGKGSERHAKDDEPFERQKICEITRRLQGSPVAGPLFQAAKKIFETERLPPDRAIHELYGAINYISAAVIILQEIHDKKMPKV